MHYVSLNKLSFSLVLVNKILNVIRIQNEILGDLFSSFTTLEHIKRNHNYTQQFLHLITNFLHVSSVSTHWNILIHIDILGVVFVAALLLLLLVAEAHDAHENDDHNDDDYDDDETTAAKGCYIILFLLGLWNYSCGCCSWSCLLLHC